MDAVPGICSSSLSRQNGGMQPCIAVDISGRTPLSTWSNMAATSCKIEKTRPPILSQLKGSKNFESKK
jgi:hypothetical protein